MKELRCRSTPHVQRQQMWTRVSSKTCWTAESLVKKSAAV